MIQVYLLLQILALVFATVHLPGPHSVHTESADATFILTIPVVAHTHDAVLKLDYDSLTVQIDPTHAPLMLSLSDHFDSPVAFTNGDRLLMVGSFNPELEVHEATEVDPFAIIRDLSYRGAFTATNPVADDLLELDDSIFYGCKPIYDSMTFSTACGVNWSFQDPLPNPITPTFPPLRAGARMSFSGTAVIDMTGFKIRRAGVELTTDISVQGGLHFDYYKALSPPDYTPDPFTKTWPVPAASISIPGLFTLGLEVGVGVGWGVRDMNASLELKATYMFDASIRTSGAIFIGYKNGHWDSGDWSKAQVTYTRPSFHLDHTPDSEARMTLGATGFVSPFVRAQLTAGGFHLALDAGAELQLTASLDSSAERCITAPHLPGGVGAEIVPYVDFNSTALKIPILKTSIIPAYNEKVYLEKLAYPLLDSCLADPVKATVPARTPTNTDLYVVNLAEYTSTTTVTRMIVTIGSTICSLGQMTKTGKVWTSASSCVMKPTDTRQKITVAIYTPGNAINKILQVPHREEFTSNYTLETFVPTHGSWEINFSGIKLAVMRFQVADKPPVEPIVVTDIMGTNYNAISLPANIKTNLALIYSLVPADGSNTSLAEFGGGGDYTAEWATANGHYEFKGYYPAKDYTMMELRVSSITSKALFFSAGFAVAVGVGSTNQAVMNDLDKLSGPTFVDLGGDDYGNRHIDPGKTFSVNEGYRVRYPCGTGINVVRARFIAMFGAVAGDNDLFFGAKNDLCKAGNTVIHAGDITASISWQPVPHEIPVTFTPPVGQKVASAMLGGAISMGLTNHVAGYPVGNVELEDGTKSQFGTILIPLEEYGIKPTENNFEVAIVVSGPSDMEWLGVHHQLSAERTAVVLKVSNGVASAFYKAHSEGQLVVHDTVVAPIGQSICDIASGKNLTKVPYLEVPVGCVGSLTGPASEPERELVFNSTNKTGVSSVKPVISYDKQFRKAVFYGSTEWVYFGLRSLIPDEASPVTTLAPMLASLDNLRLRKGQCGRVVLEAGADVLEVDFTKLQDDFFDFDKSNANVSKFMNALDSLGGGLMTCFCEKEIDGVTEVPAGCFAGTSLVQGVKLFTFISDRGINAMNSSVEHVVKRAKSQFIDFMADQLFSFDPVSTDSLSATGLSYSITTLEPGLEVVLDQTTEMYMDTLFSVVKAFDKTDRQLPIASTVSASAPILAALGACSTASSGSFVDETGALYIPFGCLTGVAVDNDKLKSSLLYPYVAGDIVIGSGWSMSTAWEPHIIAGGFIAFGVVVFWIMFFVYKKTYVAGVSAAERRKLLDKSLLDDEEDDFEPQPTASAGVISSPVLIHGTKSFNE